MQKSESCLQILVDGDACPVKDEIYRTALRHHVSVQVVSNSWFRIPDHDLFSQLIVSADFDAADDKIAALAGPDTVVVTADILLADRCLKAGATVIGPTGKPFTENSIGGAIATRAILADLRAGLGSERTSGPPPFSKADRSSFLQALDRALVHLKKHRST
ncbi:MAG: YaiI/YqxD family protein [Pseudomonadota bacterium]